MANSLDAKNARITYARLEIEDHDILTFMVGLEFSGYSQGFGGYALDHYDRDSKRKPASGRGLEAMRLIMETVGVREWSELKGKMCRAYESHDNKLVIGNILEEKWFDLDAFMKDPSQ